MRPAPLWRWPPWRGTPGPLVPRGERWGDVGTTHSCHGIGLWHRTGHWRRTRLAQPSNFGDCGGKERALGEGRALPTGLEGSGGPGSETTGLAGLHRATDPRLVTVSPERAEGFPDEAAAIARGFVHLDGAAPAPEALPEPLLRKAGYRNAALTQRLLRRVAGLDWTAVGDSLVSSGYFNIEALLSSSDCGAILKAASDATRFERSVDMAPKGYGVGTYYYFREPLMEPAAALRSALYERLQPLANEPGVGTKEPYPPTLEEFWRRCRGAGQKRSSSIILCYSTGGLNHPHRDIYGKVFFPYQALVVLSERGKDFEGGEFVLLDETPKGGAQEVAVNRGDVVIFATRERFETEFGRRRKFGLRHGMRLVKRGKRYGLGIVFHLAE